MQAMRYQRTPFLKTREVADLLGVSLTTVYNWLKAGRIPEPRRNPLSRHRLWTPLDVDLIRAVILEERGAA